MIALGWLGAICLAVAVGYLMRSLLLRFPMEETVDIGDWNAPAPTERIGTPERGFDASVHRIEIARSDPESWTQLLTHLDELAEVIDPDDSDAGVLVHRRGRKFWESVDRNGVPVHFNSDYLDRRLSRIEARINGHDTRSAQ